MPFVVGDEDNVGTPMNSNALKAMTTTVGQNMSVLGEITKFIGY